MIILFLGIIAYLIYLIHKKFKTEGLGAAIGGVFLIIIGILLIVFLGPFGFLGAAPIIAFVTRVLWKDLY